MDQLGEHDRALLKLIDEASKTAASMNRDLIVDERRLSLLGATPNLVAALRERNLLRSTERTT